MKSSTETTTPSAPRDLASYIAGEWVPAGTSADMLVDATTAEPVARISSEDVDIAAAFAHARNVGGPALRKLTFHQRALICKELGKALLSPEFKTPLYAESARTGAIKTDSWIDIDGGAGVLLSYASMARKQLPNSHVAVDGSPEMLSRDGSFLGVHIHTPRKGVAVQINAFNFPIWGMLEKFAPTFLAGMPTIAKPAPQGAFLAEAAVQLLVGTGLIPDGALQVIMGEPKDLLDHLDTQDTVGFTGSAATAHKLRIHPTIIANTVKFTAETDSLNAAVLTESATPGSPEFSMFVDEIVNEMTTKAGQKCTAIRRALVPVGMVEAAGEAIETALANIIVGNPTNEATNMGALVDTTQRQRVKASIAQLGGAAEIVVGSCEYHGVDPEAGAFISPTLLTATNPYADVLHTVEAFGPVATLIPYEDSNEAAHLVALGKGSLVTSIYGADPTQVAPIATEIACYNGRIHIADATTAKTSTGHGSPLPQLVHGGPGRAGGGEELGGMRSVYHHMQRTALQGSPDQLTAITGEHIPGATTNTTKGHPFKLNFDDLEIGDTVETQARPINLDDIDAFSEKTGDTFYAHTDEEAAKRNPLFGGIVAHGYLILSYAAGLFVSPEEGPVLANYGIDRLRFATPTKPGDEIHVHLTCKRKTQLEGRGYGEVAWDTKVINQKNEVVAAYDVLTMVANRPGVNGAEPHKEES